MSVTFILPVTLPQNGHLNHFISAQPETETREKNTRIAEKIIVYTNYTWNSSPNN